MPGMSDGAHQAFRPEGLSALSHENRLGCPARQHRYRTVRGCAAKRKLFFSPIHGVLGEDSFLLGKETASNPIVQSHDREADSVIEWKSFGESAFPVEY
jgi:hypothetical protein